MKSKQISELFYTLGISPNYRGYPYLLHVVGLAVNYHGQPFPCLKDLYQQTAEYYGITQSIVIHNIRTLLRSYWNQNNAAVFTKITGYPVRDKLTTKEFISIVAEYLADLF